MTNSKSFSLSILQAITRLYQLTRLNIQTHWHHSQQDRLLNATNLLEFPICTLNEKDYITWEAGNKIQWLAQKTIIPDSLNGYPLEKLSLKLALAWWAEDTKIYVNGKLVQEGDLFDSSTRILLTSYTKVKQEIQVVLRLVSPGHDIGALMRSQLIYEREANAIDPGFVADELTILYNYLSAFNPEKLNFLQEAIEKINWRLVSDTQAFDRSLQNLRQQLQPLSGNLKQRGFHLLGHAHLDLAWLWPVAETWQAAQHTFNSVLSLQKEFSKLTFGHTSPALYDWIEKHRPDLFRQIQEAYKAGKWEILGGMWVEPDVNLVSGESLVRQLLYGQRYFQEKFGQITTIAWLPDSFGFSWQLPQIFKQAEIDYFVTGKLHWNDTTKFPYGLFLWQSPDCTQLLTFISPPNVAGVMDTNPITMINYAIEWEKQTGLPDIFWLPGVGDHGGRPTRDMLEVQNRWQHSPFFPKSDFSTAKSYLNTIQQSDNYKGLSLPIWTNELYLEFHRGCYTTHADQKYYNRHCENLLYQAELWSSLATIVLGKQVYQYPKQLLEDVWKKVLFNQFHDILPGTSISEVFVEANRDWQQVEVIGNRIINQALQALASQITLPLPPQLNAVPIFVFNSLNWQRSQVITYSLNSENYEVYDLEGNLITSQIVANAILFLAQNIPSIGYKLYWLCPTQSKRQASHFDLQQTYIIENECLQVTVNPNTGNLESILDKKSNKEILKNQGNQLQFFQDKGQYWDAWNIDPNYKQHPLNNTQLTEIKCLETGPIQWRIRVIRQFNQSEFSQDYILQTNSPILQIKTKVNWQEVQVLVKAAFPLNLNSDFTTYEIPFAAIQRTNSPQTPEEKAKWEVCALRWADLTDNSQDYGVSLLNDCKYGYDSQTDCLRLTLLRSSQWPDPNCDRGIHHFTYAIYPHQKNWQAANTVRKGYELNMPLQVVVGNTNLANNTTHLSPVGQLLCFDAENVVISAFKQSEDLDDNWILRCYECHGKTASIHLTSDLELKVVARVNLLEKSIPYSEKIYPWKIVSLQVVQ